MQSDFPATAVDGVDRADVVDMAMKRRVIEEPVFQSYVLLLLGGDLKTAWEMAKDWFEAQGVESLCDCPEQPCGATVLEGTKTHFVLWVKDAEDFTHEITHVGMSLADQIGMPTTKKTDELLAYYNGWLGRECRKLEAQEPGSEIRVVPTDIIS